jgi:hypothetical protein
MVFWPIDLVVGLVVLAAEVAALFLRFLAIGLKQWASGGPSRKAPSWRAYVRELLIVGGSAVVASGIGVGFLQLGFSISASLQLIVGGVLALLLLAGAVIQSSRQLRPRRFNATTARHRGPWERQTGSRTVVPLHWDADRHTYWGSLNGGLPPGLPGPRSDGATERSDPLNS